MLRLLAEISENKSGGWVQEQQREKTWKKKNTKSSSPCLLCLLVQTLNLPRLSHQGKLRLPTYLASEFYSSSTSPWVVLWKHNSDHIRPCHKITQLKETKTKLLNSYVAFKALSNLAPICPSICTTHLFHASVHMFIPLISSSLAQMPPPPWRRLR